MWGWLVRQWRGLVWEEKNKIECEFKKDITCQRMSRNEDTIAVFNVNMRLPNDSKSKLTCTCCRSYHLLYCDLLLWILETGREKLQ